MKRLLYFVLLLAVVIGGVAAGFFFAGDKVAALLGRGGITVIAEGEPPASTVRDVERAAGTFNALLAEQSGGKLTRGVRLYVAASDAVYEQVLAREFDENAAAARELARVSGGWSGGRLGVTAVNGGAGVMSSTSDRYATTAHELYHQLQYELSAGENTDKKSLFWLEEGSADYVGALLAERLGGKSVHKWLLDTRLDLVSAKAVIDPARLGVTTLAERKEIMGRDLHSYQLADVMTCYLLEKYAKGEELKRLAVFFTALRDADSSDAAFERAFSVQPAAFIADFTAWWQVEQAGYTMDVVARPGVSEELRGSMEQELARAASVLTGEFGTHLAGGYELLLARDRDDLARALVDYCSIDTKRAGELAASSLWIENGSTVLVNASELTERDQQIFCSGVMLMRIMQSQRLGSAEHSVEWLARGIGYVAGVACLTADGRGELPDYRSAWVRELRARPVPQLSDLRTLASFQRISAAYSDDTVSLLTEVAVADLIARTGPAALTRYQERTRTTGDAAHAFYEVFGTSLADFERREQTNALH